MNIKDELTIQHDARIMVRWWWFGPSITRQQVSRQLQLMSDAGIGGVELSFLYPVCVDESDQAAVNYRFLSPEFFSMVRFTAQETAMRQMRLDLTLGSGWPFGGPHIPVQLSASGLRIESLEIPAGERQVILPALENGQVVLAAVYEGELCSINAQSHSLNLDVAPTHPASVQLLIAAPTRQRVKRAAIGAEGNVLDHYHRAALQAHLDAVGLPLLQAAGEAGVRAVFTDSLEVYGSNWTEHLFDHFKSHHGYDLMAYLPLLMRYTQCHALGQDASSSHEWEQAQLVAHDYYQTLTELLDSEFLRPLQDFAHNHGVLSRVQAYGVPPATLGSYRHVDLPEGETTLGKSDIHQPADWTEITPIRIAASAGKHFGRTVISGETWTRLHSPPYAATPLDMKAEANQFFLQGINQIMGHGWCQRPADGDPSQWVFYAAGNFNESNPWFPVMRDLCDYLQAASSLLRVGKPVADVAIYLPNHDVWSTRTLDTSKDNLHHINALRAHIGTALPEMLLNLGFNFDLVDDQVLEQIDSSESHPYRMILLPRVQRIPLRTLEVLMHLADQDTWVIALDHLPDKSVGLRQAQIQGDAIRQHANALFESPGHHRTRVVLRHDIASLKSLCMPDVSLNQDHTEIGYVHRRLDDFDLYFFANTSNRLVTIRPEFRASRTYVYALDLMKRTAQQADVQAITLDAYASVAYLFSDRKLGTEDFSDFTYCKPLESQSTRIDSLDQKWKMLFTETGQQFDIDSLQPWTRFDQCRHYSGEVIYSTVFEYQVDDNQQVMLQFDDPTPLPAQRVNPEKRNTGYATFIDVPIKDAAVIELNGQRAGVLFCPPYQLDITQYLRTGKNTLEIKVYNRLVNQLAGRPLHDFEQLNAKYGSRFGEIQDFDSLAAEPSGLCGVIKMLINTI